MKIHLNQVPAEGFHIEGEEANDFLELNGEIHRAVSPVRYQLDVGLSEGGLFATGEISVDLELECVRCLRLFQETLTLDHFAMQIELTGPEMIDLTPSVREDILLTLPPHPHCDEAGKNECPGIPFPQGNSANTDETILSTAPKAWDALDKLQIKPRN